LAGADANLSNLLLSAGTISPPFNPSTINYTLTVSNATTSTTVMPTAEDPAATITVNGEAVVSGGTSSSISLNVGSNTINTAVTAQDGTTKTYTVTVVRITFSLPAFFSPSRAITTVGVDFSYQPGVTDALT
jgi:hypothetical protein